jgi:hypothetical protein
VIEAYPLYWPEGWKRTEAWRRQRSRFKTGFAVARDFLIAEIKRLGGRDIILSTNVPLRGDGLPYASAKEPADGGAAVYFTYKAKPMCFACDRYRLVKENIHAIGLTIEALRGIERWGASDMMERAFRGFAALPENASQSWSTVLGFQPGSVVTADMVESRFRELAMQHHPDKGGNPDKFRQLVSARDAARQHFEGGR